MEPSKSLLKSRGLQEAWQPTIVCPVDIDDYFELADEADEFGVHAPDHAAEK